MQVVTDPTYGHKVFGEQITNGGEFHAQYSDAVTVPWNDCELFRITRVRMLTDDYCPFWDVTYCYGVLKNGDLCNVELPFYQLKRKGWQKEVVEYAKHDHVYAKGIGFFDAVAGLC